MSNIHDDSKPLPPPRHPDSGKPSATTSSSTTQSSGVQGSQAGAGIGEKIKGGWNAFHGAGEGIRGNINAFLDNTGEQIAGRGDGSAKPPTRSERQRPEEVAASGADEFRSGMNALKK